MLRAKHGTAWSIIARYLHTEAEGRENDQQARQGVQKLPPRHVSGGKSAADPEAAVADCARDVLKRTFRTVVDDIPGAPLRFKK